MTDGNSNKFPVVLTIASSDNSGGAGIQMDLYAFSMLKVHGTSVVTGVTAQNSREFIGYGPVSGELIQAQLHAIAEDFDIKAVKTGMLTKPEIVDTVEELLQEYGLTENLVVDPVLGSTVGGDLEHKKALEKSIREKLIPISTLITPNLHEAEALAELPVEICTESARLELFSKLISLGAKNVLLKGGKCSVTEEKMITDWLMDENDKIHCFESQYVEEAHVHGTGCMLSALITAHLGLGYGVFQAVAGAESLLHEWIVHTEPVGKGELQYFNTETGGSWQVHQARVINELYKARKELVELLVPDLVPEVGINFGYALPAAQEINEVCALESRIIKNKSGIQSQRGLAFGASSHVARIILTAMDTDLRFRSAVNIRYSDTVIDKAKKIGLTVGTFDRANEPDEERSMDWGTRTAISDFGSVPDIIYDKGGVGKEPMVRILSHSPDEVVSILKKLVSELGF